MTPPPLAGPVHHVAIQVLDLDTARAFYVDTLGLPLVRSQPHALWVQAGPTLVMLEATATVADGHTWARPEAGPFVVALAMARDQRRSWLAHLRRAGVAIERTSAFSIYFRDPWGARLALSHFPDATDDIDDTDDDDDSGARG